MKNLAQSQLQMNHLMISEKEGASMDCKQADTEREEFSRVGFQLEAKFYRGMLIRKSKN